MNDLRSLDWDDILNRTQQFATSEIGRESIRAIAPLPNAQAAKESFNKIQELLPLALSGQRPHMESLDLFSTWHQRLLRQATLKTLELKDVRHFCIEALALSEVLKPMQTPWVQSLKAKMMDSSRPLSAIDQIMTPNGDIRTDASERLYSLTREKDEQTKFITSTLDRLVKKNDLEGILQDRYVTTREGRWVLPVKSGMQHSFAGIIHASSQSKQTVFMEPQEIIPINNRLRQIEVEIEQEVERLLTELSQYLASEAMGFERTKEVLAQVDHFLALTQLSSFLGATACEFDESRIHLVDLRHPILVLMNETVVANTVDLDPQRRILLLSGPNAGGKTVLLKAVGLAAHMARCGLPICAAEGSKLPFFKNIHVGVGDSQSVDAHLSTFAAHLKILNQATQAKGSEELLLIDEICGSTDPEEGTALARSFICEYAKNQVFAVITSHLGGLKLGWESDSGVINGSLEYNGEKGPTYQFLMGVPGQSLAIQTARRVGVDQKVVEQALSFLTPELRAYQAGLKEIEGIKEEMNKLREHLEEERKKAREEKEKYQQMAAKLEREKASLLEQIQKKAERKIEEMIESARAEEAFRRHEQLQKIKLDLPEIIKAPSSPSAAAFSVKTPEEFEKAFPPGSRVFVPSLGRDAVIQGTPNSKGEVPILSESMRLMVDWKLLKPPQKAVNPTQDVLRRSRHYSVSPLEEERVVDLRGKSIDAALSELELALDAATLAQEDRIKVIHGHGTEALKKSVRGYLSRSAYVKKWQAGGPDTGGDGITWIELKD